MFPTRSEDRPSSGQHRADHRLVPVRSDVRSGSWAGAQLASLIERRLNPGHAIDPTQNEVTTGHGLICRKSLATAERMNINSHCLDGGWVETTGPRRHHARPTIGNGFDDRRFIRSIEPYLVGEVPARQRRIQLLDAVPLMAGRRRTGDFVDI